MHSNNTPSCSQCGVEISKRSRSGMCPPCYYKSLEFKGDPPNPSGKCMCGCGQDVPRAAQSIKKKGWVRGEFIRYLVGHANRGKVMGENPYTIDPNSGCWIWNKKITHGYAYWTVGGRTVRAARLFYEKEFGKIPGNLTIDHLCRNRACVNPKHLEAVSIAENQRRKPGTKLTMEKARRIRELSKSMHFKDIANMFGVSVTNIYHVVNGDTWKE